jgi:hypothetical protein
MVLPRWNLLLLVVCTGFFCSFDYLPGNGFEKIISTCSDSVFLPANEVIYQDNTVKLNKRNPFGLRQSIYRFKEEDYFHISVWRLGDNEDGILVADGVNDPKFYHTQKKPCLTDSNGWQLITLDIHIPPHYKFNELRIYVWNKGKDNIYFRDLKIERLPQKFFPEFEQLSLEINLDKDGVKKLKKKRDTAFKNGVLETKDDDYVKAQLIYGKDTLKANIRLKGDWLDHLIGPKWSFRVKMRKNDSWKNMRSFSLHTPEARGFLDEWIAHRIFSSEDVLTTRYGFVPVIFNGKSLGIYAYEEHFDKHLVESNNRREGPILKLTEEALFAVQKLYFAEGKQYTISYFDACDIMPFKKNRTCKNKTLYNEFLIAQNLVYQYKNNLRPVSEIFDTKSLAKYCALSDITKAYHGFRWHNIRFYYNPVICRLEPVAFDYYPSSGTKYMPENFIIGDIRKSNKILKVNNILLLPFEQNHFVNEYVYYLNKYSKEYFVDSIYNSFVSNLDSLAGLIRKEFNYYQFDISILKTNCKSIEEYLKTYKRKIKNPGYLKRKTKDIKLDKDLHIDLAQYLIKVYKNRYCNDSIFHLTSFYPGEIQFIGYSNNNTEINYETDIVNIPDKSYNFPLKIARPDKAEYLYIKIKDKDGIIAIPVFQWNMPYDNSPSQELTDKYKIENQTLLKQDEKTLIIEGLLDISEPLIIPGGYNVIIKPGTKLNFVNKSTFISYSPVQIRGTEAQPVVVTSSDGTAMGFNIFQATGKSVFENVVIDQLNTLDYNGWTLTGAVNFYESDIDMKNVTFKNNRCEDALNIIRSEFNLLDCIFDNIFADAFDSDFSNGLLKNSIFRDIANDAIDFSGSKVVIEDCEIYNAGDKGISCGEKSELTVKNVRLNRTNIAVACKDLSKLNISNSLISNSNYSYVVFKKKPEYGEAEIHSSNNNLKNIFNGALIEIGSTLTTEDKIIPGTNKKVADRFYIN